MREILFRGKRCDNGEWVQGFYVRADHHWHNHGIHKDWIICGASANGGWFALHNKYAVKAETVGQFTGLTANGKKVFEGDIVAYCWYKAEPMNFRIDYVSGEFLAVPVKKREDVWAIRISGQGENLQVIGNIHDNPELIGGAEDGI